MCNHTQKVISKMHRVLSELKKGQSGRIKFIDEMCKQKNRMLDMGFTKNTEITVLQESLCGKVKAYLIKNTVVGLRDSDAKYVNIET